MKVSSFAETRPRCAPGGAQSSKSAWRRKAYGENVYRMQQFLLGAMAVFLSSGLLLAEESPPSVAPVLFQNLCATCHGAKGEGKAELKSPSIASLPAWYVSRQLENFQHDRRGSHPQDVEGQMMRAIAKVLTAEQTRDVAQWVEKLPRVRPAPTIRVATTLGKELYSERCMECHRFNGEGELVFGAAPVVGLQDWYLAAQLRKFKNGQRGAAKDDANGQKMVQAAMNFVEDEAAVQSLAAYLMELQTPAGKPKGYLVDPFETAEAAKRAEK
jgi:cytochrome c553